MTRLRRSKRRVRLSSRTGTNYALVPSNTATDSFAYDSATGRLASRTTAVSGGSSLSTVQSWKYNGLGLLAHHYHPRPSGAPPFVVSYGYDAGLPVAQYANGIPMVTGVGYQPSGAVSSYTTGVNTGKNVTTTVVPDVSLLPRPAQIYATAQATGLRPFDTQGYSYDGAGNIKTIGADTFAYDNRSRLTTAAYSGLGNQGYSYNRYGSLLSKGATTYSVSSTTNRLTTAGYDSRGNLTTNGAETYSYDGLDRMVRHTAGGSSWNYLHDGGNERVAKVPPAGGAWTYTFRDEGNRVATEYAGTAVSRDNVFLENLAVVSYANEAVGGNGAAWTFYSSDHLGTPRLVTDLSGNAIETRKSWPYGEDATTPGTFQRLRFALMERDTEGSKYYDHARSHDFGLGRFLSPDKVQGRTSDPQTWNRYSYVLNNPLAFVDPDGRAPWSRIAKVLAVFSPSRSETVGQVSGRGKRATMTRIRAGLDSIDPSSGATRAVVTESEDSAKKIARQLDPNGRIRGPEISPRYPEHFNPESGPYKDVHVQSQAATKGAFAKQLSAILVPFSASLAKDPAATTMEIASAALWDLATTIDPFFVTDAVAYIAGLEVPETVEPERLAGNCGDKNLDCRPPNQ